MPAPLFTADGKPIAAADQAKAFADGTAHVAEGSQLHMLDADGTLRLVGAAEVAKARSLGYQLAPDKLVEEHELQREHGGLGEQTKAGVEGLARGASLGLSDVALGGVLGKGYTANAEARKEANPYTAGATQLAGAIAPSLVTGGEAEGVAGAELAGEAAEGGEAASGLSAARGALGTAAGTAAKVVGAPVRAVAKAGGLVEHGILEGLKRLGYTGESLASRTAAKALAYGGAGAAEGAAFGAGDTISESTLKGQPITSEALISSLGRNALFGGAIGGGIGALGELGPAAIGAITPSKEALENLATKSVGKQLGQDWEKIGGRKSIEAADDAKKVVAKDLLDYPLQTGENAGKTVLQSSSNPRDISMGISQAKQEIGAARQGVIDNIDAAIQANPEVAAVAAPDVGEYLARVKAQVTDPLRARKPPSIQRLADKVDRELSGLAAEPAAAVDSGVENFEFNREGMRDISTHRGAYDGASPEEVRGIAAGDLPTKNSSVPFEPVKVSIGPDGVPHLVDGRHRLQAAKEAGASDIAANITHYDANGDAISSESRPLSIAGKPAAPTSFADLVKFRRDLRDVFQPAAPVGGGLPPAPPKSAKYLEQAERILANYIDESAGKALSAMGEDAGKYSELTRQYASFATMDRIAQKQAARFAKNRTMSLTDQMLGLAGFLGAVGTGNVGALASIGLGAAGSIANKLMREQGRGVLADIAYRVSKQDSLVDAAAHALATSSENLIRPIEVGQEAIGHKSRERMADSDYVPLGLTALKKDFDETRNRVQDMSDPQKQQEQITHATSDIGQQYPEAAAGMASKLIQAHQYLAQQLPQGTNGSILSPLARPSTVPPREMQRFLTKVNAALDPASVIADIAHGKLDKDAVNTLKAVYPATYGQLRDKTMQYTAANKDDMPYTRVVHISNLFDFTGDKSLEPQAFAANQQAIAAMNQPASPGAPPGASKKPHASGKQLQPGSAYSLPGAAAPGEH